MSEQKFYMVRPPLNPPPTITIQKTEPNSKTHKFVRMMPNTNGNHIEEWVPIEDYDRYLKVYQKNEVK